MILARLSTTLVVTLSILVAISTLRAFPLGLEAGFESMLHQIQNAKFAFVLHIAASSIALAIGSVQMIKSLRNRFLALHRWLGRVYAASCAVGSVSGFLIALQIDATGGTIGFALLAILWAFTTTKAVMFARARRIADHRRWMIYSFALTFAAVTLRLQLAVFAAGFSMPYGDVYPVLAWSCWVPNIAFALWYIRRAPMPV